MDFRTSALEVHLIHQVIDKVDAAPMILIQVLAFGWIGEAFGVKSRAGIADYDEHAAIILKYHGTLHVQLGIVRTAMLYGVGKCLAQGSLDGHFLGSCVSPHG